MSAPPYRWVTVRQLLLAGPLADRLAAKGTGSVGLAAALRVGALKRETATAFPSLGGLAWP